MKFLILMAITSDPTLWLIGIQTLHFETNSSIPKLIELRFTKQDILKEKTRDSAI